MGACSHARKLETHKHENSSSNNRERVKHKSADTKHPVEQPDPSQQANQSNINVLAQCEQAGKQLLKQADEQKSSTQTYTEPMGQPAAHKQPSTRTQARTNTQAHKKQSAHTHTHTGSHTQRKMLSSQQALRSCAASAPSFSVLKLTSRVLHEFGVATVPDILDAWDRPQMPNLGFGLSLLGPGGVLRGHKA